MTKGDPIELGVILAAFYGLRRSEAVGLRWEAIDFAQKTITIRHTVAQVTIGGKSTVISKDRTKTKSSYRTLPLGKPFEDLLHRLESQQAENRTLCRNACCKKYADDIYANELGERIKPNYITQHFPMPLLKLPQNRRKTPLKSSGGGTQKNPQSLESKEIAGMH